MSDFFGEGGRRRVSSRWFGSSYGTVHGLQSSTSLLPWAVNLLLVLVNFALCTPFSLGTCVPSRDESPPHRNTPPPTRRGGPSPPPNPLCHSFLPYKPSWGGAEWYLVTNEGTLDLPRPDPRVPAGTADVGHAEHGGGGAGRQGCRRAVHQPQQPRYRLGRKGSGHDGWVSVKDSAGVISACAVGVGGDSGGGWV